MGGTFPYFQGDSRYCYAWKLAATVCTTQPTAYSSGDWNCPTAGGFVDPVFGTYCLVTNQYSCSDGNGACNGNTLRNCQGQEQAQPPTQLFSVSLPPPSPPTPPSPPPPPPSPPPSPPPPTIFLAGLYHGWSCPIQGCNTSTYNAVDFTNMGGTFPYFQGDSRYCYAWKLAATVCTTQPTAYSSGDWNCPTAGGFVDPVFGTYCLVTNQYSCSDGNGACNGNTLRNCQGQEQVQPIPSPPPSPPPPLPPPPPPPPSPFPPSPPVASIQYVDSNILSNSSLVNATILADIAIYNISFVSAMLATMQASISQLTTQVTSFSSTMGTMNATVAVLAANASNVAQLNSLVAALQVNLTAAQAACTAAG